MIPRAMKYQITICSLMIAVSLASATPPSESPVSVTLNFPQNDVGDILSLYASLTHYKIVRDSVRYGPLSLSVPGPLPPPEAIDIIEKTLFANGYSIIQVDANTVEIIGPGKNPRAEGVPTISEPSQLPTHERLVSYLFQLKHADATKLQQLFAQYLSPPKPYTSFLRLPDVNAVWVTERTSVIRELLKLVEKIDVPQQDKQTP
jgi:type II secretory pathway component GspD/PulD (secretin)